MGTVGTVGDIGDTGDSGDLDGGDHVLAWFARRVEFPHTSLPRRDVHKKLVGLCSHLVCAYFAQHVR